MSMNASRPGRIVMLVDNAIDGDSRVQKAAKSMAEAGWEVHLIGKSAPRTPADSYELGAAQAHRVPLQAQPLPKTLRQRLVRLRHPLAYATIQIARHNQRRIKYDRRELQQRYAPKKVSTGRKPSLRQSPRIVQRVIAAYRRRLIEARARQTKRADLWVQKRWDGRVERVETAFWRAIMGDRAWRKLEPVSLRFDMSFSDLIEELRPDLIHAHDFRMIGVAARATTRARAKGRNVKMVYDAHEFVPGVTSHGPKWLTAQIAYEREYIGHADAIATVSPALADMLVETHGLPERPIVTLNAPPKSSGSPDESASRSVDGEAADVRSACGLGPDVPLMVYCGGAADQRCLHTMVESLEFLPEVHAAFLINILDGPYVESLREIAARIGASDRIHLMPYVHYEKLVDHLSTADVGVHPLRKGLVNHDVALSTKYFEFMQARLPIVVSDVRAMSESVAELGNGEVFESENAADLARAVGAVLADPERYRKPYTRPGLLDSFTWEAQAEKYIDLYERLLQ